MKLSKVIFSIIVAAGFVACSSDEDGAQSSDTQVNALYSDVEIRFGSSNLTRGAIDNSTQDVDVDGLGIFMLAEKVTGLNPEALPVTWDRDEILDLPKKPRNPWGAPEDEDNAKANATFGAGGTVGSISWADGKAHFYPAGNWYKYQFYGYYPYEGGVLEATATQRKIHYDSGVLNGETDILCGWTECDEEFAYSARYFRVAGNKEKYPTIAFEHVLMSFQFWIQGSPDENEAVGHQYDTANYMEVKSIKVKDLPLEADLIVADREATGKQGTLEYDEQYIEHGKKQDLDVKQKVGEEPWRIHNNDEISIGEALMVPVMKTNTYEVEIVLKDNKSGKEFEVEKPLHLKANGEYQKGTRYKVLIQIAGAQQISLKATLTPWIEDDSTFNHLELN